MECTARNPAPVAQGKRRHNKVLAVWHKYLLEAEPEYR